MCLLFGELVQDSAWPLLSPTLREPGERGFPQSSPPKLLPSVAWPLPALSRFCSGEQRQGQLATKWFWGREQLLALKADGGIKV